MFDTLYFIDVREAQAEKGALKQPMIYGEFLASLLLHPLLALVGE